MEGTDGRRTEPRRDGSDLSGADGVLGWGYSLSWLELCQSSTCSRDSEKYWGTPKWARSKVCSGRSYTRVVVYQYKQFLRSARSANRACTNQQPVPDNTLPGSTLRSLIPIRVWCNIRHHHATKVKQRYGCHSPAPQSQHPIRVHRYGLCRYPLHVHCRAHQQTAAVHHNLLPVFNSPTQLARSSALHPLCSRTCLSQLTHK